MSSANPKGAAEFEATPARFSRRYISVSGRSRISSLRHPRLPARPHRVDGARTRFDRGQARFRKIDGGAENPSASRAEESGYFSLSARKQSADAVHRLRQFGNARPSP